MATGKQFAEESLRAYNEGWGYIWGTSGQVWTQAQQDRMAKDKADNPNYAMSIQYGSKWIGKRVTDCSGLPRYAGKKFGLNLPHSSNALAKKGYVNGVYEITDHLPEGALVFKLRNGNDYYHVGVVIGADRVVEARGTKAGVVISKISEWTHYGLLKGLDYSGKEEEVVPMQGKAVVDVPNDGSLNVREKPSTVGRKVTTLLEGTQVEVLAVSGDWAKIRYSRDGYVMTKYLKVVDEDA